MMQWEIDMLHGARRDVLVAYLETKFSGDQVDLEGLAADLLSEDGLAALGFRAEWGYGFQSEDFEEGFHAKDSLDDALYMAQRKPHMTGGEVMRRWSYREYFDPSEEEFEQARKKWTDRLNAARAKQKALDEAKARHQAELDEINNSFTD
jgi:hypothetical protein